MAAKTFYSDGNLERRIAYIAKMVFEKLGRRESLRVVTAESCTGGMIGAALTGVSGISRFYSGGYIVYSDEMKMRLLGVKKETLESYGAVSLETAREMARGAAESSGADAAVAVTGIAGPGGGSAEKPVGLVCFGFRLPDGSLRSDRVQFRGGRAVIRKAAALHALKTFFRMLGEQGPRLPQGNG